MVSNDIGESINQSRVPSSKSIWNITFTDNRADKAKATHKIATEVSDFSTPNWLILILVVKIIIMKKHVDNNRLLPVVENFIS